MSLIVAASLNNLRKPKRPEKKKSSSAQYTNVHHPWSHFNGFQEKVSILKETGRNHIAWYCISCWNDHNSKDITSSLHSPLSNKQIKLSMFLQRVISSMIGLCSEIKNIWLGLQSHNGQDHLF